MIITLGWAPYYGMIVVFYCAELFSAYNFILHYSIFERVKLNEIPHFLYIRFIAFRVTKEIPY